MITTGLYFVGTWSEGIKLRRFSHLDAIIEMINQTRYTVLRRVLFYQQKRSTTNVVTLLHLYSVKHSTKTIKVQVISTILQCMQSFKLHIKEN